MPIRQSIACVTFALLAGCSSASGSGDGATDGGADGANRGDSGAGADIHCEVDALSNNGLCTCIEDSNHHWGPGNTGGACSVASVSNDVGNATCCKSSTYPGVGTCQCEKSGCFESASACACGNINGTETATSCVRPWALCCRSKLGGLCQCSNVLTACHDNEIQVASCSIKQAGCSDTETLTSDCR